MSFPITCTACHKTFTISNEIYEKKVAGRVVTIKCKSCGQGIRVDGTKSGDVPPAPAPAAAPATPAGEPLWAVDYPDGQDREFSTAEVTAELERGVISGATLVWRDGMAEWLEIHQVPELAAELAKLDAKKKAAADAAAAATAAAAAAAAAAAKASPVHQPRAPMPTVTGLAGLPGAVGNAKPKAAPASPPAAQPKARAQQASSPALGTPLPKPRAQAPSASDDLTPVPKPRAQQPSTPELPKPRAQQPSTPELPKPRTQQPSTPELPKPRAQQPSTPELPKPRAQQGSAPVLAQPRPVAPPPVAPPPVAAPPAPPPAAAPPFPAPAAPAAPPFAIPAEPAPRVQPFLDATPPLPASVAKVVSRPPAVAPSFPISPAPVAPISNRPVPLADHASVEWPEAKSKKPMIIVGVVVVVAAAAGAAMMLGGKDDVPKATPISALPASPSPTPTPTAAPSPTPRAAAETGAETASGSDPIVTGRDGATPGAGFAELFAAGARKAESKGASVAPANRFDAAATKAPLAQAATEAQACKQSGGPTGKVTVVVTFDPNGKVSSATITDAPFAGTATAACISSALKRAAIAPFSGLPGTVSKTFSIL